MSNQQNHDVNQVTDVNGEVDSSGVSRRKFLGGAAAAAAVAASGVTGLGSVANAAVGAEDFEPRRRGLSGPAPARRQLEAAQGRRRLLGEGQAGRARHQR